MYGFLEAEPVDYEVGDEDGAFAFFQKIQPGGGALKVEILKDGEVVVSRETSTEWGSVDVIWPSQVETTGKSSGQEKGPELIRSGPFSY